MPTRRFNACVFALEKVASVESSIVDWLTTPALCATSSYSSSRTCVLPGCWWWWWWWWWRWWWWWWWYGLSRMKYRAHRARRQPHAVNYRRERERLSPLGGANRGTIAVLAIKRVNGCPAISAWRTVPYYTRRILQHPASVRISFTPFPLLPFLFPTGQIAAANAISAPIGASSSSPNTVDD